MNIKTGDMVKVIAGKDRGKTGKVMQTFREEDRVVVDGVNKMIKNLKARSKEEKGQKVEFFGTIHVSNVQYLCAKCSKAARVGKKLLENGKRVRVCGSCKETIS